jgi:hypothetical protein
MFTILLLLFYSISAFLEIRVLYRALRLLEAKWKLILHFFSSKNVKQKNALMLFRPISDTKMTFKDKHYKIFRKNRKKIVLIA